MRVLYNTNGFMFEKENTILVKNKVYLYEKMALLIVEYIQINMCI